MIGRIINIKKDRLLLIVVVFTALFMALPRMVYSVNSPAEFEAEKEKFLQILPVDTPPLPFPVKDDYDPSIFTGTPFDLDDPSNWETKVKYDPNTQRYIIYKKIGERYVRYPKSFTLEEYLEYDLNKNINEFWKSKQASEALASDKPRKNDKKPFIEIKSESLDKIFGGDAIQIRPQGQAELSLGVNVSKTENPALSERQRKVTTFDFDQKIQFSLAGSIGDKLKMNTNFNTEATFDFENQLKLNYEGKEDDIIKKLEAGNVSFATNNSLITGSQTLFGIKTQLQFGRLTTTTVFSQQKGQKSEIEVSGGAQTSEFDFKADQYEANKHYFLAHYFRDQYDQAMKSLPNVSSPINITRIEVWVTNNNNTIDDTRNFVAFADLGEDPIHATPGVPLIDNDPNDRLPKNDQNNLYGDFSTDPDIQNFSNASTKLEGLGYRSAVDYEKIESARKLPESAYTINKRLGFISLNSQPLNNDEVLAVAFEYTINGKTYQVGQFSTDGIEPPKALMLKMLKSTITNPKIPMWDLMMKNIYTINAFQVNKEDFTLNIFYNDPQLGVDINYIPFGELAKVPLVQALGMDRLDPNNNPFPDGIFDYVDNAATTGGTINARNGRIFFPVVEPFGATLAQVMQENGIPQSTIDSVAFQPLYDSTKVAAQQLPELNRFTIKGTYKSASGSEIALNALNIPKGSVVVTAGGVVLQENVDYTIDYNLGRVKIINQGLLESQQPIKVSLESNSLFSVQQKTLIANRFDYRVNKDINVGATFMKLSERPITQKVNFGDEPINNMVIGFDGNFETEAPFLTKMVDKLPFIETKEKSNISFSGEYAQLIPGHSKAIGNSGTSYIDDFEGSQSTIDLRAISTWTLASVPQGQPDIFPEGGLSNDLAYNYKRAQLSWKVIDPLFFRNDSRKPDNIDADIQSNHLMREVRELEIFKNRQQQQGTPVNISMFDLSFNPRDRGPYNYNTNLNPDGTLISPEQNWAGISRRITTNDFENSNVEFIQFWVMDPFNEDSENSSGGKLYFNLGNISEDILRDSRKSFENGLPKGDGDNVTEVDTTVWGVVPNKQSIVNAFDNTTNSNKVQDIGLDGLNDENERVFFQDYLNAVQSVVNGDAFNVIQNDPSNDNYHYYQGGDYDSQGLDILERYERYNGLEGNSPTQNDSPESYPTSATTIPSTEDINLDNNLSESESYFQYEIDLDPTQMVIGQNYITDIVEAVPDLANNEEKPIKWYQFKVPVRNPDKVVGGIQDFRSVRFIRMFVRDFSEPVVLRFARLEFTRGEWRKYDKTLFDANSGSPTPTGDALFDVAAVNLEENADKQPVNYTLPPGITREVDAGAANIRQINEQSLLLKACDLEDGDARGTWKSMQFDARAYRKLEMFVHAEAASTVPLNYGDVTVFIRLGSDFDNNYYEYELPVTPTDINGIVSDPSLVWPEANNMVVEFDELQNAKRDRNNNGFPVNMPYSVTGKNNVRITVKGNPVLSDVRNAMIGIRNPAAANNEWTDDQGRPQCAEVWVNELRMTDFRQEGGWAAVARMTANLADFGNVAVAGNISTPGYGSIEKRVSERQRETKKGFDASTNLELGKFLPEKTGVKVPVYFGYSEQYSNPQYDPLSPDLELDESLKALTAEEKRQKLQKSQSFIKRRSINFTNVRKEKTNTDKPTRFYDVENVSVSYAFNETYARDINTERRYAKDYRLQLAYAFANKPKFIRPFESNEFLDGSKYLKLIKDFNFSLAPRQIGFRTSIDRRYQETLIRNNSPFSLPPVPTVTKTFTWDRVYDVKYDLTNSIKLDFNANNQATIRENPGLVDKNSEEYKEIKRSINSSLKNLGENTHYLHNLNATYRLPTKKFPLTDWTDVTLTYGGSYDWERAPFSQDSIGNTIQNSQNLNVRGQFNMLDLYNKIPYFKKVNAKKRKLQRGSQRSTSTRNPKMGLNGLSKNTTDSTKTKKEKKPKGLNLPESIASIIMSLKNVNVTYSKTQGMLLPGYSQKSQMLGMDGFSAPGFMFITGLEQSQEYPFKAAEEGWLVKQPNLFQPRTHTYSENMNVRGTLEPIRDMRIDINFNSDRTESFSDFFRWNADSLRYESQSVVETGNYSTTIALFRTAFKPDKSVNFQNEVFDDFIDYTVDISKRQGTDYRTTLNDTTPYYNGFSGFSQDVVVPAFIAAYTGKSSDKVTLNPFKLGFSPNWKITYDGFKRIPWVKERFRSLTVGHGYQATYNTSYTTNLQALDPVTGERVEGANGDFLNYKQIQTVSITESFAPLFKLDMTWKNSLITSVEFKKQRRVGLSLSNLQITEDKNTEYVFGAGYRFKDVKFPIEINNKEIRSDVNVRVDVSIRKNITLIRRISEQYSDPTAGRTVFGVKAYADYVISQRVSLRAFYEWQKTKPALSIPFPTSNTNAGISVRLTLTQ